MPVIVTRASNNYGPYQFPEKILPLFVTNLMDNIPVPLYGDGGNVRDWLHVLDHCRAIDLLMHTGTNGEVYNIGGGNEVKNIDLTHKVLKLAGKGPELIKPVADRKGHDRRYSLGTGKLRAMGWAPQVEFEEGLRETVAWYQENEWWWRPIKERDPGYKAYIEAQYGKRVMACVLVTGRRRLRRQPPDRAPRTGSPTTIVAWLRPGTEPLVRGTRVTLARRSRCTIARPWPRRSPTSRPSAIYHLAGVPHVGDSWAHTSTRRSRATSSATHHLFDALRRARLTAARPDHQLRVRLRAARSRDHRARRGPARTARTAPASSRRKCWRRGRGRTMGFRR